MVLLNWVLIIIRPISNQYDTDIFYFFVKEKKKKTEKEIKHLNLFL